jgi:hypothetical protein
MYVGIDGSEDPFRGVLDVPYRRICPVEEEAAWVRWCLDAGFGGSGIVWGLFWGARQGKSGKIPRKYKWLKRFVRPT